MEKMKDNIKIRTVLMEETYRKIKGKVYWYYRFQGNLKWTRQLTSYKDVPWVEANWGDFKANQ